jgi:hypothetical protein
MALRTGSPNNLAAARKAFRQHTADRERYEAAGLGPGDAYRGMWAYLHDSLDRMKEAADESTKRFYMKESRRRCTGFCRSSGRGCRRFSFKAIPTDRCSASSRWRKRLPSY